MGYLLTVYTLIDVTSNDTAAEGSVRLVGGVTVLEGRVEIFLLGQWGAVCDERWDHVDATVVCRELGYPRAVEAPGSAFFGAGSGPSWYESVRCVGTERNLTDCSKNTYNFGSACPHSQDAGVVCSSECSSRIIVFLTYMIILYIFMNEKNSWESHLTYIVFRFRVFYGFMFVYNYYICHKMATLWFP